MLLLYAQVHPAKLTQALMAAAQATAGAQVVYGTVTGLTTSNGAVTGVKVQQQQQQSDQQGAAAGGGGSGSEEVELAADAVVLAMGPWTDAARAWLPDAPHVSGNNLVWPWLNVASVASGMSRCGAAACQRW